MYSSRVLVDGKINYNVRKEENGNTSHFTNIIAGKLPFVKYSTESCGCLRGKLTLHLIIENVVFITGARQATRTEREDGHDYEAENSAEAKQ